MDEIIQEIKELLAEQLKIEVNTIDDDADILDDLGADSLEVVEMLMSIESKYGITVPDDDVPLLKTVSDVAEYISEHQ